MTRTKWLLFSIPLLVFGVMVYFFGSAIGTDPSVLPSTRIGKPVPTFSLATIENPERVVTQQDLKGPLLLNVWATWCPTCLVEHPMLLELSRQGIPMIGVNYKDEPDAARQYLQLHGNPFQLNIADIKGDFGLDLGVYGAPETFLIDAEGRIHLRFVGAVTPESWRDEIWPKWQEMGGKAPAANSTATEGSSS